MQKLNKNIEKYCIEFSFQHELVPFSEGKIHKVVCAVLWNTE